MSKIKGAGLLRLVIFSLLAILGAACAGANQWMITNLVSQSEQTQAISESALVRNCGAVEHKTIQCSAGTSNDISVSFGGSAGAGYDLFQGSLDSSVSSSLGIGRDNGESLELDAPPGGYVYIYNLDKLYRTISGEALAKSTYGTQQNAAYVFYSSCSLSIQSVQQLTCDEAARLVPTVSIKPQPAARPTTNPQPQNPVEPPALIQPTVDTNPMKLWVNSVNGCQVNLNGVIRDVQGPWNWDWGDGASSTGWFPQDHTFPQSGSYVVRVSANSGEANSINVSVSCP